MRPSLPVVELEPRVRAAFEDACLAVFATALPPALAGRHRREFLLGFAAQYQRLMGLRRRDRRSIVRRAKQALGTVALLLALGQAPAWAATIAVTPGTPPPVKADGKCSLIEAIVNANTNSRRHLDCVAGSGAVDQVILPADSQQVLANADLKLPDITSRIVIEGNGSTIRRTTESRLTFFSIATGGDLTLNETVVSGDVDTGYGVIADGITNRGRLVLNDSSVTLLQGSAVKNLGGVAVITGSSLTGNGGYDDGGGVSNYDGTVTVTNSVISGNQGYFGGGGLYNAKNSTMTVTDTIVSGNQISYEGAGGGIENRGTLVLVGTTVTGNESQAGGGIANAATGTATIRRSTISGNSIAAQYEYQPGGGIANNGTLILANSTVSGNSAPAVGSGIFSAGSVTLQSSTVTGIIVDSNSSQYWLDRGGGVSVVFGTLSLQRSIVSGNALQEVWADADAVVTANDFNLFGRGGDAGVAGFTPGSTDIVPNEPLGGILRPLADNGGTTRTHALAIGSPALNASPDDDHCFMVDQRGNPRPRGPRCDIGSFEGSAVLCSGRVTTMVGTDGPDELTGTPGPDVIAGLNGDDAIGGLEGNDVVCGGGGADRLFGGAGNDTLFGQGGNDQLSGNGGNDSLNGGDRQDQCNGGANADTAAACEAVTGVP